MLRRISRGDCAVDCAGAQSRHRAQVHMCRSGKWCREGAGQLQSRFCAAGASADVQQRVGSGEAFAKLQVLRCRGVEEHIWNC